MKHAIRQYLDFQSAYSKERWLWLKIPFGIFWFVIALTTLFEVSAPISPKSMCQLIDCNWLLPFYAKITVFCIASIAFVFYMLERKMLLSTAVLSIVSVFIFSMEDSEGVYNRNDILSAILITQFIAYLIFTVLKSEALLNKQRIFFSQQVVVAIYFLSGVAKLITAGFTWFLNTEGFAVQVKKANMDAYISSHNASYIAKGETMASHILAHPGFFSALLLLTLLIELGVVVSLFSKKWMICCGLLLLAVHVGIWCTMSIVIIPIIVCNSIFLVNILYLAYTIFRRESQKPISA